MKRYQSLVVGDGCEECAHLQHVGIDLVVDLCDFSIRQRRIEKTASYEAESSDGYRPEVMIESEVIRYDLVVGASLERVSYYQEAHDLYIAAIDAAFIEARAEDEAREDYITHQMRVLEVTRTQAAKWWASEGRVMWENTQ